jgi:hypothetical protein
MHLFVLDLNGVLAKKRPGGKPAILRPHVRTLLEGILQLQRLNLCRIAIWTSITEMNAQVIINQLLTLQEQSECLFIWNANQCKALKTHSRMGYPNVPTLTSDDAGTPHPEIPFKSYKDLAHVWNQFPQFNEYNTTLFDDSPFKGYKQPLNTFCVTTFNPNNKDDTELLRILDHIQTTIGI